ncbi:MAG: hypothetical protein EOO73_08355 [Myxococcales bacterium]|nr:MAG: hypothetical protein EOO73_08355 [Myxococcales bacterium]
MERERSKLLPAVGLLLVAGCSSARDVEVSGRVTAPSALAVGGALVIDFIDVVGEGRATERTVVHRAELSGLGELEANVMLEGDQVLVRVIDDRDGDGECSLGEAWGETHAPVEDDEASDVSLMLGAKACPAR